MASFGTVPITANAAMEMFVARFQDMNITGTYKNLENKNSGSNNSILTDFIKIYPNPTTNIINIEFTSQNSTFVKCKLINVIGSTVFNQNLKDGKTQIDMSYLPAGIYILKVETTNKVYDYKIVKQ